MKRRSKAEYLVVAALLGAGSAGATEEPADPTVDAAFLEYLGSWDDTDEDWTLFADDEDSAVADGNDEAPDGDESAERSDET